MALLPLLLVTVVACSDDSDPGTAPPPKPTAASEETISVLYGLSGFVEVAEGARVADGSYPASASDRRFADSYVLSDGIRATYRPNATRSQFRLCIQRGKSGPWTSYDTRRGGLVSLGDKGRCSFDAPASEVLGVRADVTRIYLASLGAADCEALGSEKRLRRAGLISKGNRLVSCTSVEMNDGDVLYPAYCIQHGKDGAWAIADGEGMTYASGGSCPQDVSSGADG